jgi:hypothetical protein
VGIIDRREQPVGIAQDAIALGEHAAAREEEVGEESRMGFMAGPEKWERSSRGVMAASPATGESRRPRWVRLLLPDARGVVKPAAAGFAAA